MSNKRILIVDDDKEFLKMLKMVIEHVYLEYQVVSTTSGTKALSWLDPATESFDLIIADYSMPMMNGLKLARKVRQTHPDTHIVLMTAYPYADELQHQVDLLNLDDCIQKPFTMKELKGVLNPNGSSNRKET